MRVSILTVCLLAMLGAIAIADTGVVDTKPVLPRVLNDVGIDQHLDQQVPGDLPFVDDQGNDVRLGDYFERGPIVLVLAYYQCPMLCNQVLNGLVQGLRETPFTVGRELQVVVVSFDPREKPSLAAAKKKSYVRAYQKPESADGWHFLTGTQEHIRQLADTVGFRYAWDERTSQFAHAAGIMILTPSGKLSRYFYDVRYPGRDLRLGLVEASNNQIGTAVDQVLLFCFHYDPTAGKYGAAITNFVRVGGVLSVVGLIWFFRFLRRGEARHLDEVDAEPMQPPVAR